jgi:hypothetical protein
VRASHSTSHGAPDWTRWRFIGTDRSPVSAS